MGCAPSQTDRRRLLQAYHGVAAPIAAASASQRNGPKSATSSLYSAESSLYLSDGSNVSDYEAPSYQFDDGTQRVQGRKRRALTRATARDRRLGAAVMRKDNLLNFGTFHLSIVDELATAQGGAPSYFDTSGGGNVAAPLAVAATTPTISNTGNNAHFEGSSTSFFSDGNAAGSGSGSSRRALPFPNFQTPTGLAPSCAGGARLAAPPLRPPPTLRGYRLDSVGGHPHRIRFVLLSPIDDLLFSCTHASITVLVHHLRLGCEVGRLVGHDDAVLSGDMSPSGQLVATTSRDMTAVVWDATTRKMRLSLLHPKVVLCCRFHPREMLLVTSCQDGVWREWSLATGAVMRSFVGAMGGLVCAMTYSADGGRVLGGGSEQQVAVWGGALTSGSLSYDAHGCCRTLPTVFTGHTATIVSIHTRYCEPCRDDIVVSVDERLTLVWGLNTLATIASYDVSSFTSARRASWTACSFAPFPCLGHILLACSDRSLYLLRFCDPETAPSAATAVTPQRSLCGMSSIVSGGGGDDRVMFARPRRPHTSRRAQLGRGQAAPNVVLSLYFRASVGAMSWSNGCSTGPDAAGAVAVGDGFGNTYILHLW